MYMKHFILALTAFCSASVMAESVSYDIDCYPTKTLLSALKKIGEIPTTIAANTKSDLNYVMLINETTKTWTFIGVDQESKMSCVLASGDSIQSMNPSKNESKRQPAL